MTTRPTVPLRDGRRAELRRYIDGHRYDAVILQWAAPIGQPRQVPAVVYRLRDSTAKGGELWTVEREGY